MPPSPAPPARTGRGAGGSHGAWGGMRGGGRPTGVGHGGRDADGARPGSSGRGRRIENGHLRRLVGEGPHPADVPGQLGRDERVGRAGEDTRPGTELGLVLARDDEHLADDTDRQGVGEIGDRVHLGFAFDGVEQSVDELLNSRSHRFEGAWRERQVDEPAQALVVGRVHEQEGAVFVVDDRVGARAPLLLDADESSVAVVAAEALVVAEDRRGVREPGERLDAERGDVHGVFTAEAAVAR